MPVPEAVFVDDGANHSCWVYATAGEGAEREVRDHHSETNRDWCQCRDDPSTEIVCWLAGPDGDVEDDKDEQEGAHVLHDETRTTVEFRGETYSRLVLLLSNRGAEHTTTEEAASDLRNDERDCTLRGNIARDGERQRDGRVDVSPRHITDREGKNGDSEAERQCIVDRLHDGAGRLHRGGHRSSPEEDEQPRGEELREEAAQRLFVVEKAHRDQARGANR
mmetsp:Transcript_53528/g.158445  ORF Transcript_53528/g.158445 Transcript_53528/m.158445 type:complete len:221 (-) Transcript_53528:7-669(-)